MQEGTVTGLIFNIQKFSIHDGPGIRTTVFLKGCPLRCGWCSNPESQRATPQMLGEEIDSRSYPPAEVLKICLQDRDFYLESGGGVTLSGGEALTQGDFVRALLPLLKKEDIHTALETTGYVSRELLMDVAPYVDLFLYDVKHYDGTRHAEGTGVDNRPILENLAALLAEGNNVLVRIPVIPGYNDGLDDARQFTRLLKEMGVGEAQLLPFHQFGDRKYQLLNMPYAYQGIKALYPEDLEDYAAAFSAEGIRAFF